MSEQPTSSPSADRRDLEERLKCVEALPLKRLEPGGRRILHYVSEFSVHTQTFIYDLIRRLDAETEHDNIVLCRMRVLADERPYDKVLHLPWDHLPAETVSAVYRRLLERCEIDMAVVHFAEKSHDLGRIEEAAGLSLPTLVMTHGYDVFELRRPGKRADYVTGALARRDDVRFTAVSPYLAGELEVSGVPGDRITVVPNTVHGRFFQHRKTGGYYRPDGRRPLRLLNIGRLFDLKGHRFLLDAMARFERECGDVELTIVYGDSGPDLESLKAQAARLGIGDRVIFEPFIDFAADPGYISRFDLYIHCSTYTHDPFYKSESFGIAVLEAIASGLPVIATDAGGTPQVVGGNTPHSRIVPHGSADTLFQALAEMATTPETFTDNIDYARNRLDTFSPERQITEMQRLIRLLTGS